MGRHVADNVNDKKSAPRRHRGFVALVSLAAIVALGVFGVFGMLQPDDGLDPDSWTVAGSTTAVEENDSADGAQDGGYQIVNDPQYGDFEAGKVLVHVDESTDLDNVNSMLQGLEVARTKDVSGQDVSAGFVEVEVDATASMSGILSAFEDGGLSAQPNYVYYLAESDQGSVSTEQVASAFAPQVSSQSAVAAGAAADPGVTSVAVDDPGASQEWYLESLDLYRAWGIQTSESARGQAPVSVAVIDSGCLVSHEDLKDNIVATYNSVSKAEGADQVEDEGGHGTHVAGIVSARANNGIGAIGTSYNAGLVIVKANNGLDSSGQPAFTTTTLASAYEWFLSDDGSGSTVAERYNLRVVNMSLGGPSAVNADDALYAKITQAREAGILTVCAAGNSGGANAIPPYNVIPGDYADCFTVINLRKGSSTTPNDSSGTYYVERSSSSNYNVESGEFAKAKNISAPGTAIYSTLYSGADQYGEKSGTSMASPATAGVAALMFAYDPSLSAADVQALLEQTATDINEQGWDRETGYGEVDAYHALQVLSAEIALGDVSCGESAELALSCADGSSTPASEWTWTSSDPGVLTVDTATGTAKANMRGAVTLTATHPCGREISKEVSVMAVDLSDAQIAPIDSQLYTGDALEPAISVSLNGQDLVLGTDYTVSFLGNVNVGDVATVTVNGMGNYTGTATATFTILPRSLNEANAQSVTSQVWSGSALTPVPVVRFGSRTLVNGRDFDIAYENNKDVGTARFVITGKGNYTGVIDGEFIIAPRDLSNASVSIASQSYTGKPIEPNARVVVNGVTLRRDIDYIIVYSNNTNAGTATASVTGIGNYSGSKDALFTISGGALSPMMITINNTPTYSGTEVRPSITVRADNGTILKEHVDYVITGYENNLIAGNNTAFVTIQGKGSYTGTVRAPFSIKQASLFNATVGVATQTYTGKALTPRPTVTLSGYGTLREGTDYTVAYGSNVNVGTGSVTIIGTGNCTGSRKATFKIEPKPGASTGGGSGSSTAPSGVAMHRLYNPNSGEHFYTASAHERDSLRRAGWKYEGVGWTAPASSRTPVYRLYSGTDHHYTASAAERDMLVRAGWKYEGVGWYSDDAKGVPLYRQFNPNVNPGAPRNNSGSHNYTTSRAEHDHLVSAGWRGEGIGWYGM